MEKNTSDNMTETARIVLAGMKKRRGAETRFQWWGRGAIVVAMLFLVILFADIIFKGHSAFRQTMIGLDIYFDPQILEVTPSSDPEELTRADYQALIRHNLRQIFPDVRERRAKRQLYRLVSQGASYELADEVSRRPSLIGNTRRIWLPADDEVDMLMKGHIDRSLPESERRISNQQIAWIDHLDGQGRIETGFNTTFFTAGDSRDAELAGIRGALSGSLLTLLITLAFSFPIGVAAAVYLEEFAPQNRWTNLIEVNINNLAAVPSIVFGLLGLAVYINVMGLPRSAPLVGGLVLTLMTLPTIIISGRAALKSVPAAIRESALGVGASPLQATISHVLPLAMPGMLTGTIIGMAQALGETAPLLMIGMVAFIVDIPSGVTDPSTVLPVQIFLWADSPERAFVEKTSGAIMVLLAFLIMMNSVAVMLRKRLERRW